jgi:hypothetical protein
VGQAVISVGAKIAGLCNFVACISILMPTMGRGEHQLVRILRAFVRFFYTTNVFDGFYDDVACDEACTQ